MKRISTLLFMIVVGFMTSCYYDNEEKLYSELNTNCDLENVTYSATIRPILQASCYTCHSNANYLNSGGGIKLENHADLQILANNGKLMGAVTHASGFIPMPKDGGKLPECEISQLQKWVDNQAPNN